MEPRDRQQRGNSLEEADNGGDHALDQLVEREQHIGLGEALPDDGNGMGDLALPLRNVPPLDQFDHHRDVPGLHEIEHVFAQEEHGARGEAETENAAPACCAQLESVIAERTDAPAEAGAYPRDDDEGGGDAEIDEHAEDDEWQGAADEGQRATDGKVPHATLLARLIACPYLRWHAGAAQSGAKEGARPRWRGPPELSGRAGCAG